jgi:membrane-bound lytic murein transglycosylase D
LNLARTKYILIAALTVLLAAPLGHTAVRAVSDPFPVYPCIQPNVAFWTRIYTEYSSRQGVIHDKRKMNRIYGVIELVDPDRHGGRKINQRRIKKAKKFYRAILGKLMRGKAPSGPVEQRVAGFFGPDTKRSDYRSAIRNIRCQIGQKDRFRAGIIRSGAYLDEIRRIFRASSLPEDLAYLPHVESSFNPKAYSKFGAAGIWQFTRSTGKHFMKVGYAIDERRDPILSSYAAAKLLQQNYQKLKSWPMAITAYNHGLSGMLRARRSRGTYAAIFKSYRSRIFRFASRNFYSEFLAAREAAQNFRRYFGDLGLDPPTRSRELVLAGYVSLPEVGRLLQLDLADLRKINPALRHPVFSGQKYVPAGYRLRLPPENSQNWETIINLFRHKLYRKYQKTGYVYAVRKGDTAGKIARNHGVRLNDLIAANNLDSRATIYVNQKIKIPPQRQNAARYAQSKAERKSLSTMVSLNSREIRTRTGSSDQTKEMPQVRVVGDTSWPMDLWQFNRNVTLLNVHPDIIQDHLAVKNTIFHRGKPVGAIRVEVEETLGHYAEWTDVPAREIRQLNGLRYGRPLHLNQQIKIPLHRMKKEAFEEKRLEYHQGLAEDFFTSYRVDRIFTYTIKRGDNIWTLSRQEFEVPLWLIKRFNADVDFNNLVPSQKLQIPVLEKKV